MQTRWIHIIAPLILIALIGAPFVWKYASDKNTAAKYFYDTDEPAENAFAEISLLAKAAYVYDARTGEVLYAKNGELQFPLASITKIMTAVVAVEHAKNDATFLIRPDTLAPEGDSGFSVGEEWNVGQMVDMTLVSSSNDGARALAGVAAAFEDTPDGSKQEDRFVAMMNKKARELGLAQTYFLNESGLDEGAALSGSYGSAKDIALLLFYTLQKHPSLMEATAYEQVPVTSSERSYVAKNTNKTLGSIPGIIASKTGFTDLAGGNLAIVFEAGPLHPIIVVVLGSSEEGRFQDVEHLADAAIKVVSGANPAPFDTTGQ